MIHFNQKRRQSFSSSVFVLIIVIIHIALTAKVKGGTNQQQTRAVPPSPNTLGGSGPTPCPLGCECDTPGVVSCIGARLSRLPLRLPLGTKFFYAEHNRFAIPTLTHRNFTNYIGPSGRSSVVGMSLHNCSLTHLGFRTFTSLKSLQELDLSNNRISIIEDNTFNGLNLNMLDLSHNVGIQFSKQAFCGCTVRRLALRAVGLKNFDLQTFSFVLPSLMSLSIADNRLLSLDYRIFSCAPNLSTVYFARNPWWCGGDCSTLKLINHVNSLTSDIVMDEAPTCQPGYEEQQDPELNKEDCQAMVALNNKKNNTLPECPVQTVSPQTTGRSLANGLAETSVSDNEDKQDSEFVSANGGFVTWGDGNILANYSQPVTSSPGSGNVIISASGGCFRLSTVVAASTMASVATLVIVLSLCLCVRACYLKCNNREQPSAQSYHHQKNAGFDSAGNTHPNKGAATRNGNAEHYKNRQPLQSGAMTLVPNQGQPLLMHSGSDSSGSTSIPHHHSQQQQQHSSANRHSGARLLVS